VEPEQTAAYVALLFFVVSIVSGAVFATVNGLKAWRTARAVQGTLTAAAAELARGAESAERKAAQLEAITAKLERATARLRESVTVLQLLTATAGQATAPLRALLRS
jgi:hypothetical protein